MVAWREEVVAGAVAGAALVPAVGLGAGFEACFGIGLLVDATACGLDT